MSSNRYVDGVAIDLPVDFNIEDNRHLLDAPALTG